MTRKQGCDWNIFVTQSLEDVETEWARRREGGDVAGVIHIGFGRPPARIFNEIASINEGRILATQSAKYVLPSPYKFSEGVVQTVDGIPLYVALEGWGYTLNDPTAALSEQINSGHRRGNDTGGPQIIAPTGWVAQFLEVAPEFEDSLKKAQVHDEASYLERENLLTATERAALGQFRFDSLVWDATDALEIVRLSPPWLRSQQLKKLPITVRLHNVFNAYGIERVSDLDRFTRGTLLATKNFGKRSYTDLSNALLDGLRLGPTDPELENSGYGADPFRTASSQTTMSDDTRSPTSLSAGLISGLLKALNEFDERDRQIMLGRMGFAQSPRTLEDIGSEFGVSRERIRQVEKRSLDRLIARGLLDDVMRHRLGRILNNRSEPLPLFGLEVVDDWFRGTSKREDALAYLIENLCDNRFYVLRVGSVRYVSRIDQDTWEAKLKEARQLLESAVGLNWSEEECRNTIDTFLQDLGGELTSILWSEASLLCHFSGPPDGRVLTAYGRGIEQLVQVALENSLHPIHTSEVAQMVSKVAGREIGESQVRNAVANVGLLLGRGTYGLRKHVPLSDEELEEIARLTSEIVAEHDDGRQWHAAELVTELQEVDSGRLSSRIDKYVLSLALQLKSDLKYLGRLVWTLPDSSNEQRVDLRDAVIRILEGAGGPLTTSQITDQLTEFRGVNSNLQIWSRDPVLRVGRGLWGLNDRDVPVKRNQQPALIEEVLSALRKKGAGIHIDEIESFIRTERSIDPEVIFSIAATDDRIGVGVGRFAYLKEWGDTRRVTLKKALDRLKQQVPGLMSISDIKDWLEFFTERKIDKSVVSHSLSSAGMRYVGDDIWEIRDVEETNEFEE